ncbi:hypothetical protein HanPSC8_Chr10g0429471 [Helianthus annuus]|nr:hypothetical protein HanPSC8_Chr10g0429471 [Helianthus annuus]
MIHAYEKAIILSRQHLNLSISFNTHTHTFSDHMDESWRIRMGATTTATAAKQPNNLPPRRSPENTNRNNGGYGYETLYPEDFDDVFGGPPRSVLARQFSCDGSFARPTI